MKPCGSGMTFVLGLTGSIGMGKTTTAEMFRELGYPVHDADAEVHRLYEGDAVAPIAQLYPDVINDGRVDRSLLSARVLGSPQKLKQLEAVIHPLVRAAETNFLSRARADGAAIAILDIPLLFETGAEKRCDAVAVVTAGPDIQRARVLARPGMTEDKLARILARQMPDTEKRSRADFVVDTGHGLDAARAAVQSIVHQVLGRPARAEVRPPPSGKAAES